LRYCRWQDPRREAPVSLPDPDLRLLDEYARRNELSSRSGRLTTPQSLRLDDALRLHLRL